MLPRARRPHDQFLNVAQTVSTARAIWVAGIGGLIVGHMLWLAGISIAIATRTVSSWVLVVAVASFVVGIVAGLLGWRAYRKKSEVWAAFLCALPISPVLLSLVVLGVTYL
jgi:cytochrome bd-type quinol oxidase subunit 2